MIYKRDIRVLQLSSSIGLFGAERVVLELVQALQATQGVQPMLGVFCNRQNPHTELVEHSKKFRIQYEILACRRKLDLQTITALKEFVRENQIAIIHTHGYKTDFYAFCAAMLSNVRLVATCHPWIEIGPRMKFYSYLDRLWLRRFDKLVAVSDDVKAKLLKSHFQSGKIELIHNGIDLKRFQTKQNTTAFRRRLKISADAIVIGSVGRLAEEKGHAILLSTLAKLAPKFPELRLLFVGDGERREELQNQTRRLGLEAKVSFLGIQRNIPELLSLMDVFVLPSLTEGFPLALLEAMAAKKPVVASAVGDIPKIIQHGKNGILVEPADANGLANAIARLVENKPRAMALGENAYSCVKEKYTLYRMLQKYLQVYDEVLSRVQLNRAPEKTQSVVPSGETDFVH